MRASLTGQIVASHPSAVYRGTVYTQDVLFEVEGVPKFHVYDPSKLGSWEVVGTERACELYVFCAVITESRERERRIAVDDENRPVFRGRVTELNVGDDGRKGVLDVGAGTVLFRPDEADEPLHVGSWIRLTRATIHLLDFDGWDSTEERYNRFVARLRDGTEEERRAAARYFGKNTATSARDDLVSALHYDDSTAVRCEAATALGRIGMTTHPDGVERQHVERELGRALKADDDAVEEAAHLALDDIRLSDENHLHGRDW
ncbi:HEAT repeat domain-containing protein [Haloferax namakaokahaiae]|uniref:HEAT repeat domain-containing protein n=1 Tax=Haloferax namakaokahaiae TaxID=1748331 RepID=A0ABD5ZJK7_9EURY